MRTLAVAVLTGLAALVVAGSAAAAPTYSLSWSGTSGTGATGGSAIDAVVGDTLTVDVIITIDTMGFIGAAWDLTSSGGGIASTTALLGIPGAGGPPECPAPPNLAPGTCFGPTFKTFGAALPGVGGDGTASQTGYDVVGFVPEFGLGSMTVGRGVFVVTATNTITTTFAPGVGGVTDGSFTFSIPAAATATVNVIPEPGTAGLMGLGLAGLAMAGRRRRS